MNKFKLIDSEAAKNMSKGKLQFEIGRRTKYLREELGMGRTECAEFVSSLLNMGAAMDKIFESEKTK